jgi:hypothetical protein
MPSQSYALEAGGPERLTVSWKGSWKQFTVKLDGDPILMLPDQKALSAGHTVTLPEGSQLAVKLVPSPLGLGLPELTLTRNGTPLPRSAGAPETRVRAAVGILSFLAVANILLGLVAEVGKVSSLLRLGLGTSSIIGGAIYGLLAVLVQRHSLIALAIAILLVAGDGVMAVVVSAQQHPRELPIGSIGPLLVRTMFILCLLRGFGAIRQLRAVQQQRPVGDDMLGV